MSVAADHFPTAIQMDVFRMLCGDEIASGQGRTVFNCAYDSDLVVKIETRSHSFQNVMEWNAWHDAADFSGAQTWLAPCVSISACGIVLIQKKTTPTKNYPDKVPSWFTDLKRQNFGTIDGRFVCHDYGTHLMCNSGITKRLKKADWWDE